MDHNEIGRIPLSTRAGSKWRSYRKSPALPRPPSFQEEWIHSVSSACHTSLLMCTCPYLQALVQGWEVYLSHHFQFSQLLWNLVDGLRCFSFSPSSLQSFSTTLCLDGEVQLLECVCECVCVHTPQRPAMCMCVEVKCVWHFADPHVFWRLKVVCQVSEWI